MLMYQRRRKPPRRQDAKLLRHRRDAEDAETTILWNLCVLCVSAVSYIRNLASWRLAGFLTLSLLSSRRRGSGLLTPRAVIAPSSDSPAATASAQAADARLNSARPKANTRRRP